MTETDRDFVRLLLFRVALRMNRYARRPDANARTVLEEFRGHLRAIRRHMKQSLREEGEQVKVLRKPA